VGEGGLFACIQGICLKSQLGFKGGRTERHEQLNEAVCGKLPTELGGERYQNEGMRSKTARGVERKANEGRSE